ncbi:FtsB family cell division protein [Microbacterium sp. No. 7]|uniref:FtsB family cell division protein n=1 Tax=Microbacterium sp. No. 7 TaxID=1714373 RepID=UPI0006ECD352|nr:septum formation initiator family protein [Microbacterium sp. No. 7]ALJ19840.1 septum formation initiator [Microbacterium sp. No. 7]
MDSRTASPSRVGSPGASPRAGTGRVSVREWFADVRFSGFVAIMLGLVVLAVFVLMPTVGTYIDQRQRIAELERSVQASAEQIAELERDRERWTDRAYLVAQARERLYYVFPGEVVYLVDNDLPPVLAGPDRAPVSSDVEQTVVDWPAQLLRSVVSAGVAQTVTSR